MSGVCGDGSPTNCDDALHDLYEFLDGELTPERKELIRHHIDDCSPCLEAFDFENELRVLVARKCRDEAPEALRARVADAIAACEGESEASAGT